MYGVTVTRFGMPNETFLASQLRDSAPYLEDAGYRETAKLLQAAADEIDMLHALVARHVPELDLHRDRANENMQEELRKSG